MTLRDFIDMFDDTMSEAMIHIYTYGHKEFVTCKTIEWFKSSNIEITAGSGGESHHVLRYDPKILLFFEIQPVSLTGYYTEEPEEIVVSKNVRLNIPRKVFPVFQIELKDFDNVRHINNFVYDIDMRYENPDKWKLGGHMSTALNSAFGG